METSPETRYSLGAVFSAIFQVRPPSSEAATLALICHATATCCGFLGFTAIEGSLKYPGLGVMSTTCALGAGMSCCAVTEEANKRTGRQARRFINEKTFYNRSCQHSARERRRLTGSNNVGMVAGKRRNQNTPVMFIGLETDVGVLCPTQLLRQTSFLAPWDRRPATAMCAGSTHRGALPAADSVDRAARGNESKQAPNSQAHESAKADAQCSSAGRRRAPPQ